MSRAGRASLPFVETCLLTLWLGAALFFAAAVAPAAFAVLPTPSLAGALVGRLLPPLFAAGIGVGAAVLAVELRAGRARSRVRAVAGGVLLVACGIAQFVIGGQIERLRARSGAPISALGREDPRRVTFGRLHALSVAALGAAMLAAATAVAAGSRSPSGADRGA
ncbi:MAG: DUF4149 domain-containing protein [Gemmatimonadaceae bacterium]